MEIVHSVNTYPRFLKLFCWVMMVGWVYAQPADVMTKLRMAQSLEQAGEYERAVVLYEDLLGHDPSNYIFFDGLRRMYVQLKQYNKAIQLVQQRLQVQRNDVQLGATLGGLYYDLGDEQKADSIWKSIVQTRPVNVGFYRVVASQMMEHRLYDRAIDLFLSARTATGDESAFSEDLASLYSALQQYRQATEEYVRVLRSSPAQLLYVQSRISAYTIRVEGFKAATAVVSGELARHPNEVSLYRLRAWLSMEERDYGSAYADYQKIDRLSNANGNEVFAFAQRAAQEGAYRESASAFKEVVEHYSNLSILPRAKFGYARAVEELSATADTALDSITPQSHVADNRSIIVSETQPGYQNCIRLYEKIIADDPNSEFAVQSIFRIGMIRFEKFFDLDGAMEAFDRARHSGSITNFTYEATLKVGEVLVTRNNLDQARSELKSVARSPVIQYRDKAKFMLAEIDYYESEFDSSLSKLQELSSNVSADLSNDALELMYFIQENQGSASKALGEFAQADLLLCQRKFSEALARFQKIEKSYPNSLLLDDTMMKIGELELRLKRTEDALATFQNVIVKIPLSILKDKAQMRIAETYQNVLRDKARAVDAYQQLLAKYPSSLYVEEARKRIRILRGDSI